MELSELVAKVGVVKARDSERRKERYALARRLGWGSREADKLKRMSVAEIKRLTAERDAQVSK